MTTNDDEKVNVNPTSAIPGSQEPSNAKDTDMPMGVVEASTLKSEGTEREVSNSIAQEPNAIADHSASSDAPDESQVPSVANVSTHSSEASVVQRPMDGTKSRFRALRAVAPGAVASFPSSSSAPSDTTSISTARNVSDEFSNMSRNVSEELSNTTTRIVSDEFSNSIMEHPHETSILPNDILDEEDDFKSYHGLDAENDPKSSILPSIVTAEIVEDGNVLDQKERERIVQETIESMSKQVVSAEIVPDDNNNSARRYRVTISVLALFLILFVVVVVVVVFTTRSSSNSTAVTIAPTRSPTPAPTPFVDDSIFYSIEELYEAVDAYYAVGMNNESSLVETSEVALRYGYPISTWNVSLLNNFSYLFDLQRIDPDSIWAGNVWEFNEDLGDWDVSNAETLAGMFQNVITFQGIGLENWNVGKVKDFSYMFSNSGFNGTISGWDTSSAETMAGMFYSSKYFNEDLSAWNTSQVQSMSAMFSAATSFEGIGLEYWDVHNVRDFSYMFSDTLMLNASLSGWDTSNAENMEGMFSYNTFFNDNLSLWDVSKVTAMTNMFYLAQAYTGEGLASWDVSKVRSMDAIFADASLFNGDVSNWDVSKVTSLSSMVSECCIASLVMPFLSDLHLSLSGNYAPQFQNAGSFNRNLSSWNVSGVESFVFLFSNAVLFNGDVSTWDVSNVGDFSFAFSGCTEFNGDLSSWNTDSADYMNDMFSKATKFKGLGLSTWNTSSVISMDHMFDDAKAFVGDLSLWDVSFVGNMNSMFDGAVSFNSDVSQWNVSSVYDASYMFFGATSFNQSLCSWQNLLPSNVLLDRMFLESGCEDAAEPTLSGTSFCASCIA